MDTPVYKICTKCHLSKPLDQFYNEPKSADGKAWYCKTCIAAYNAARRDKPKILPQEKRCRTCRTTKPIDEFGLDQSTKDGHATRCKVCKQGESIRWQTNNRKKTRAATAKWRAENPEKVALYNEGYRETKNRKRKERYAANSEKENAQNRVTYALNKDKWRPTRHAWEVAHQPERKARHAELYLLQDPEERRARDRAWGAANPGKVREKNHRRRARKKNAPVNDLSEAQWQELLIVKNYRCEYCKPDCPECKKKTHDLTKDHVTPYTLNGSNTLWNVVPACLSHNSSKKDGPPPVPAQPLLLTMAPSYKPKKKRS